MQTETVTTALASPARVLAVGQGSGISGAVAEAEAAGHSVLRASGAEDALDVIASERPDVVIVESFDGTEMETLGFCAAVHGNAALPRPAVFLLGHPPLTDTLRREAWRAGVWHVAEAPVDPEELSLRIDFAVSERRSADRTMASSLVDPESGLYNAAGLARRTRELTAEAMRRRATLACIVITAEVERATATRDAAARAAEVLRTLGRLSDVVGRVGPMEYIILAPATREEGAAQLARRLAIVYRVALIHALPEGASVRTQAGYSTLSNLAYAPIESADILARATAALRSGRGAPHFAWVNPLDINPRPST